MNTIKHEVGDVWKEESNPKDCQWMVQFTHFRDGFSTKNIATRMAQVFEKKVSIDRKELQRVKSFLDNIGSIFNNELMGTRIKREYRDTYNIIYKMLNGDNGPI